MQTLRLASVFCLFIGFTVVLNSIHSKELVRAPLTSQEARNQQTNDDGVLLKIQSDLHNHIDKAGKVLGDNPQTDTRSLRLLQNRRHTRANALSGIFSTWRDYLALHLG